MENDNDVHLIQNLSVLLFATPPEKQILDWMVFFMEFDYAASSNTFDADMKSKSNLINWK